MSLRPCGSSVRGRGDAAYDDNLCAIRTTLPSCLT
ncbi:hypothetical protein D1O33_23300 [Rhodococcus rhodochrous]|nr:hypothetical protein D1O33_23300 [Rhodococcus rhodochrous]